MNSPLHNLQATTGISVIVVCNLQHVNVWQLTSQLVPQFIPADEYILYVPMEHLQAFRGVTHSIFAIESQESITAEFSDELHAAVEAAGNTQRLGWYAQQLIKIEALRRTARHASIIWDADCVPLCPMNFFDEEGHPRYMRSSEHHGQYFEAVSRLLGLPRIVNHSFIGPGFPIPKAWGTDFITAVEQFSGGLDWASAIIASTDLRHQSGFSEFESMGTWISHAYPGKWSSRPVAWERLGRSRFGEARGQSVSGLMAIGARWNLEVVSFENWDEPNVRTRLRHGSRRMRELMGRNLYS